VGEWRKDQSKGGRRVIWGQTRGEQDSTRRNFLERMRAYPVFKNLKVEKIGSEIHIWRVEKPETGPAYWTSCIRFLDDSWGYWDVWYRPDERRWRSTGINKQPVGKAIAAVAEFYQEKFGNIGEISA